MRRFGIILLAGCGLLGIHAQAADNTAAAKPLQQSLAGVAFAPDATADSPLVRAARMGLEARKHPRSRIVIDSNTLIVSYRRDSATTNAAGAPAGPDAQGRSWTSGNQGDAAAITARDRSEREHAAAAEKARVETLRQEQSYLVEQDQQPYAEVIDDHVANRLETIPAEIKTKPPM